MDEGRDATRRDAKEQSVAVEPPTEGSNAIHAAVAGRRTFSGGAELVLMEDDLRKML